MEGFHACISTGDKRLIFLPAVPKFDLDDTVLPFKTSHAGIDLPKLKPNTMVRQLFCRLPPYHISVWYIAAANKNSFELYMIYNCCHLLQLDYQLISQHNIN